MSEWGERPTPGTKREKPCNLARLSPDPRADRYASSIQRRFRTNLSVDCRPRQAGLTIARLYLRPRLQFEFDRETRQCDAHRSPPLFRFDSLRFGSVRFDSVRFGSIRIGSVRLGSVRFGSVGLLADLGGSSRCFFVCLSVGRSAEIFPGREKIQVGGGEERGRERRAMQGAAFIDPAC